MSPRKGSKVNKMWIRVQRRRAKWRLANMQIYGGHKLSNLFMLINQTANYKTTEVKKNINEC